MYAKPPSELNLDPVTCQVGFAAVLCIMQTTTAAEMRDHDSWRGSQQAPAGPWTGQMRCGRDEGPDPAEACTSQSTETREDGGHTALVTTRLSLRSCGETLIGIRGRWPEHGRALCRRPSWALRHACDERQITQPPRLPERASTLGGGRRAGKIKSGKGGGGKGSDHGCHSMDPRSGNSRVAWSQKPDLLKVADGPHSRCCSAGESDEGGTDRKHSARLCVIGRYCSAPAVQGYGMPSKLGHRSMGQARSTGTQDKRGCRGPLSACLVSAAVARCHFVCCCCSVSCEMSVLCN